jgi:hypothetical protein
MCLVLTLWIDELKTAQAPWLEVVGARLNLHHNLHFDSNRRQLTDEFHP